MPYYFKYIIHTPPLHVFHTYMYQLPHYVYSILFNSRMSPTLLFSLHLLHSEHHPNHPNGRRDVYTHKEYRARTHKEYTHYSRTPVHTRQYTHSA